MDNGKSNTLIAGVVLATQLWSMSDGVAYMSVPVDYDTDTADGKIHVTLDLDQSSAGGKLVLAYWMEDRPRNRRVIRFEARRVGSDDVIIERWEGQINKETHEVIFYMIEEQAAG